MVLLLLAITSLFLPDRVLRMLEGDFRSYRVQIPIQGDQQLAERLRSRHFQLYDTKGLVGEIRDAWNATKSQPSDSGLEAITVTIGTDRKDLIILNNEPWRIELRKDGSFHRIE
ncbi:hypothetical protein SH501x_004024 [Pirellulaceae bacterium SH501]